MIAYKGFVSHIVYRNEENSYTVFELTLTESADGTSAGSDSGTRTGTGQAGSADQPDSSELGDVMTCVGYPVSISEGESCVVEGEYTTHPVYGEQLRVRS